MDAEVEAQIMTEPEKTAPVCLWPQCQNYVGRGDPFCREHWYRLPQGHRDAVRAALEWVRRHAA